MFMHWVECYILTRIDMQVRFHPTSSSLLASGSLDYEVRLWNADTAECINVHNFGKHSAVAALLLLARTLLRLP